MAHSGGRTARVRAPMAALLAALLLAACATPPPDTGEPWTSGRMALRVDASEARPAQSLSAGFELRGSGERGELRLSTPLGTQLAQARWSPGVATLATPQGEQQFDSLDALSRQALGEALPLAALPDWVAGRPWPGAAHVPTAEGFEQMGWQVQTLRRAEGVVEARRIAAPTVLLRLRIEAPT